MVSLRIIGVISLNRFVIFALALFLTACSSVPSGLNKEFYTQAESYARVFYETSNNNMENTSLEFYDEVKSFLDQPTNNEQEKEIISLITELHILSSLFIAQDISSQSTVDTKQKIDKIVDALENSYNMNIAK